MLHKTDAGEFAVITVYSRPYIIKDPKGNGDEVILEKGPIVAMAF